MKLNTRTYSLFIFLTASLSSFTQSNFEIIDVSQKEIRLINALKNEDSLKRSKIFADSLYHPYKNLWSGYIGEEANFVRWINNKVLPNLEGYNKRNEQVNGKILLHQFDEVKINMQKLTGYNPIGKWYIIYGPAWTNLGGLSGGTMLIDLSHNNNSSNENIMMYFPHEITHQIYANVNTYNDTTAMGSIIGEGFAVYMNQMYWKDKYTLAQNLGYTDDELKACESEKELIKKYFENKKYSTDEKTILTFRSRSDKLKNNLPGAIGYYIGYKIIDAYVNKFGKDAWKDVFIKSPMEIYTLSEYRF